MQAYYRALAQFGRDRPDGAYPIAGGWSWFRDVALHRRGKSVVTIAAHDLPGNVLDQITRPRSPIAGLSMDAPRIMGILNVTPDSFSDGGQFVETSPAVAHAAHMVTSGADLIDVGGESTRPGAAEVSVAEEVARTEPVIAAIKAEHSVPISIDTRKSQVAGAAVAAGANLINDVAALTFDPDLGRLAAETDMPVCLMHAQGNPETMQYDPQYEDVLLDVYDFLNARIDAAVAMGIARDRIVIDPGIGFGKTIAHNLALLRGLSLFHALGCPILLGASRKRFIGAIGGGQDATDRVAGSVAIALEGLRQGVQISRVHDTFETKQAFDLQMAISGR